MPSTTRWSRASPSRAPHKGPLMGVPATGKLAKSWAIAINRFTDGKVAEIWCTVDMACLFSQIGALRSLPPHPRTSGPQRSESDALPRIPPRPHARACAPANSRRCRSSRCGLTCSNTAATRLRSTSTQPHSTRASFQALLTHLWGRDRLVGDTPFRLRFQLPGRNRSRAGNGVRNGRLWAGLLGVEKTTVGRVEFDEDRGLLVAHVRPARGEAVPLRGVPTAVPGL